MKSLVSVLIPCYQQGRYLADCISSLINQSHQNWEALIIDDGSTDDTHLIASVLCKSDDRVRYFHKENGGLSSARNLGLEKASGAYIQFLDADDLLERDKIQSHVAFLENQTFYKIVYGNAKYFTDGMPLTFRRQYGIHQDDAEWIEKKFLSEPFASAMVKSNMMPVCCPLLTRAAVDIIGHFDEDLKSLEDWNYWLRAIAKKISFFYINTKNGDALIRTHLHSMTNNSNAMHQAIKINRTRILTRNIDLGLHCWIVNIRMLLVFFKLTAIRRASFFLPSRAVNGR